MLQWWQLSVVSAAVALLCLSSVLLANDPRLKGRKPERDGVTTNRTPQTSEEVDEEEEALRRELVLTCNALEDARAKMDHANKQVEWTPKMTDSWGNVLSPYWQARGAAYLAGYRFQCSRPFGEGTWIEHLPMSAPPPPGVLPNLEAFAEMCNNQGSMCDTMLYAHKCLGSWIHIVPIIRNETRNALAQANPDLATFIKWHDTDMVLFDRCAEDTICSHDEHCPLGFSAFKLIPKEIKRIFYVFNKDTFEQENVCKDVQTARIDYIMKILPHVKVILSAGERVEDWAKLVFAPNVFIAGQGSSFALWSTLANPGRVWSPMLFGNLTPDVGPNYRWLTNHPLLTPLICESELQVPTYIFDDRTPHAEKIVAWLRSH